jgi:autotransporter-associated beta strand protein
VASGSNIRISNGGTLVLSDASNNVSLAANRGITLGEGVQKLVKHSRKTATINGVISGVGGLNFGDSTGSGGDGGGGGRYQINAANTYSGETTISYLGAKDPGVVLNHSLALQNTTLNYNNANATGADLLWFNGANSSYTLGGLKGDKTLNLSPQSNTARLLKIGNNGESTTFSGVIRSSHDAAAGIMKVGSGTLTLSGANTYTGPTTVGQGTLSVSSVVASGSSNLGNATSAVILGDSTHQGTLAYTGGSVTFTRGLNVAAGGGRLEVLSGRTLTLGTGWVTGTNALLTIGGGGNTTLVTRVNLGLVGGGLVKEGEGILSINSGVSDGLQNYRTLTTMAGAGMTNVNSPLGTGLSDGTGTDVVAGGNLRFGNVSQTLNSLSIGEGATVTFTSELAVGSLGGSGGEKAVGLGSAVVPEASSVGLLMLGSLGILGRRRLSGRAK